MVPPLHIKLGLMKQFVKALNKNGGCFKYLCRFFPGLSLEKLKAGIFDSPQIRKLISDPKFTKNMTDVQHSAWSSFVSLVKNFLGNHKALNYVELVENMLTKYQEMGANMSIKVHFLHSHLDRFPKTWVIFRKSKVKDFTRTQKLWRRDIKMGGTYVADYCWCLQRDCPNDPHHWKSYKQCFQKRTKIET